MNMREVGSKGPLGNTFTPKSVSVYPTYATSPKTDEYFSTPLKIDSSISPKIDSKFAMSPIGLGSNLSSLHGKAKVISSVRVSPSRRLTSELTGGDDDDDSINRHTTRQQYTPNVHAAHNNPQSSSKVGIKRDGGSTGCGKGGFDSSSWESIIHEISALHSELVYYRQLSGRESTLLNDSTLTDTFTKMKDLADGKTQSGEARYLEVCRYMVQLVCQCMTYLLQGEVELHNHRSNYAALTAKVDTLNR